ncbi:hypothetical protein [Mesobacillus maritimus]|uniref:ABC transporter permease n=1 Tax=Mesobacillus maritimus TaxID=1643336 RepID=A0ABS7K180_9BACI|nr:hypothetical protein [Mesobacillus maritimus]MBY0095911.1 hypothetical protein [Mesobacillus maritimus]
MQDFRTLKLLDRFEKVFSTFGIDYKIMRKILQVKLMMDRRRVPTIFTQNAKKNQEEDKNQYIKSLWIYVLFGLFMVPFMLMGENYLFQMSLFFGIFTFFVMTSMISDFSSVLLDIRDRNILFPKPVDRKSISAAKAVHIFIYISFLTIALVTIPLLVGLVIHGPLFLLVTIFNIILIDIFVVVLTALIYMFVLKFFDGEKLKDIINYVQIGLSLAIMVGYQLLVRSFEFIDLTVALEPRWWQGFIFPMWYGANIELVMNGHLVPFYVSLSLLGILIPLISIWLYTRLLPAFEQNLQKLSYHGKAKVKKRSKLGGAILTFICTSNEEKAFFRFASLMMKNERDFKLKVYPSLGFSIVIPFIFIMNGFNTDLSNLSTSKSYLTIYFSLIIIPTVMVMLKYSGKYKGAWIYKVTPIKQLKPMFSGTIKAFLVKLFFPLYILLSLIMIALFGVRILPDLITVFINACTYCVICFMILNKSIPFSASFDTANQNSNSGILFMLMLFVPVFAGLHFVSTLIPFGSFIYLLVAFIVLLIVWKPAFNLTWEKISD